MKSQSCVTILAILNAMIARVSSSLSQIDEATRGLCPDQVPAGASGGTYGPGKAEESGR